LNLMFFILPWLLISAVQLCPPIRNLPVYLVTTLALTISSLQLFVLLWLVLCLQSVLYGLYC
jgi:hypothetical protein